VEEIKGLTDDYRKRGMTVTFLAPDQPEYGAWKSATAPLLKSTLGKLSPDVSALFAKE